MIRDNAPTDVLTLADVIVIAGICEDEAEIPEAEFEVQSQEEGDEDLVWMSKEENDRIEQRISDSCFQ